MTALSATNKFAIICSILDVHNLFSKPKTKIKALLCFFSLQTSFFNFHFGIYRLLLNRTNKSFTLKTQMLASMLPDTWKRLLDEFDCAKLFLYCTNTAYIHAQFGVGSARLYINSKNVLVLQRISVCMRDVYTEMDLT